MATVINGRDIQMCDVIILNNSIGPYPYIKVDKKFIELNRDVQQMV
jgi:hypothetical protein